MDEATAIEALRMEAAWIDPGAREVLAGTGADRIRFLQGLLTADVAGTPVGGGCRAALLTPKGHVVTDMWVFVRREDVRIVVPSGQGASTAAALSRYAIMDDFAAAPLPELRLAALLGPRAAARLQELGVEASGLADRPAWSHLEVTARIGEPQDLWLVSAQELGQPGCWVGGNADAVSSLGAMLEGSGVRRLTPAAVEIARIAAGEPRFGAEITSDYFPMEVGLGDAINYEKGCYLGQEPIVRVRDRGHTNWRLVRLEYAGDGAPAAGDALESDIKARAGRVTSAARLPGGQGVALALLHVSVPVGSEVRMRHGDQVIPATVVG